METLGLAQFPDLHRSWQAARIEHIITHGSTNQALEYMVLRRKYRMFTHTQHRGAEISERPRSCVNDKKQSAHDVVLAKSFREQKRKCRMSDLSTFLNFFICINLQSLLQRIARRKICHRARARTPPPKLDALWHCSVRMFQTSKQLRPLRQKSKR